MTNSVEPDQTPRGVLRRLIWVYTAQDCLSVPIPRCITAVPSEHTTLKWSNINVDATSCRLWYDVIPMLYARWPITLTFVLVSEATFYDQAPPVHYSIMIPNDILYYWSHQISAKSMKSLWTEDEELVHYKWTIKIQISVCIRLAWPWFSPCTQYHILQYLVILYGNSMQFFKGEVTLTKCLSPFLGFSKRKEFTPMGSKSFPFRVDPFQNARAWCLG